MDAVAGVLCILLSWNGPETFRCWPPNDTARYDYAVLDIQTDWPAWLEVTGARFWSHGKFPCPLCMINQEQLCQPHAEGVTIASSMPHELFTHDMYETALRESTKLKVA